MAESGNKKHNYNWAGMKGVVETSKWGDRVARERYGESKNPNMKPKDMTQPQDKQSRCTGYNDVPASSWLRGGAQNPRFRKGE
jgi:hypothetical protein